MPRIKQMDNDIDMRKMVKSLLISQGRDFTKCELCGVPLLEGKAEMHHTKYEGATIYDIQIVCRKCNLKPENVGLQ